jgi:hypothetical protein
MVSNAPTAYDDVLPASSSNIFTLVPQPISTSPEVATSSPIVDALSVSLPPPSLLHDCLSTSASGHSSGSVPPGWPSLLYHSPLRSPRLIASSPRLLTPEVKVEAPTPIAITFPSAPTESSVAQEQENLAVSSPRKKCTKTRRRPTSQVLWTSRFRTSGGQLRKSKKTRRLLLEGVPSSVRSDL